jgi:hypothetical protein
MAIVVLVLWMFTAGAGFYLLVTSSLGRTRPSAAATAAPSPQPAASVPQPAASVPQPAASVPQPAASVPQPAASVPPTAAPGRDRWAPPSLVASREAPILPSGQSLVEFAHPAVAIIGLGFWLGFALVHNRVLGWIAFGLAAVTVCVGLGWFTANSRAARRAGPGRPAPSFAGRLVALHGSGAALTLALAALAALVFHG